MEAYWYFDFASPFAYLQLPKVREWRSRLPLTPVPVLARVLPRSAAQRASDASGVEDSAEGFVRWRAKSLGVALTFPPEVPFNSIAALRLCAAAGSNWRAIEAIFAHIWHDGQAATTLEELRPIAAKLGVTNLSTTVGGFDVGAKLRANTDAARSLGVTAVPAVRVGSELFDGPNAAAQFDNWLAMPALRHTA